MVELDLNYEELLATFAEEATEEIAGLESGLLALETAPHDAELRADLLRYAHTLKGNASCVGLTSLTAFAHAYEEMLERMDGHDLEVDRALATLLLSGIENFRRLLAGGLAPVSGNSQQATGNPARRSLRVSADRLNRMLDLAGEISIARGRVQQLLGVVTSAVEGSHASGTSVVYPGVIPSVVEGSPASGASLVHTEGIPRPSSAHSAQAARNDTARTGVIPSVVEGSPASGASLVHTEGIPRPSSAHSAQAARNDTARAIEQLVETERELDFLHGELQEMIMRARMVPVGPLFRQYARTVRDLASAHGKSARLVTIGDDVEIDTTAVEMLRDPLTHMIRNAIDHGLETPAERLAAGKPDGGTITLEALHEAGSVIIRISDDGAGLDREAIAARAARLGIDASDVERVIFENGFSTAEEVTDLSGRGVGMDVVRRGIESLRGTIKVESRPALGTSFTIRLPLTLAVIDGFAVSATGETWSETWIVPMANVIECVELPAGEPRDRTSGILLLRDEIVPYVRLRSLFALHGDAPARENVLVVQHDGMKGGLVIDHLHGASQAVIKPLGDYFAEVPGIAGSSILGSGRVALILDVRAIFDRMEKENAAAE